MDCSQAEKSRLVYILNAEPCVSPGALGLWVALQTQQGDQRGSEPVFNPLQPQQILPLLDTCSSLTQSTDLELLRAVHKGKLLAGMLGAMGEMPDCL
ncbi:hypothetical protein NQZ68_004066 [Dissostichus eleginoides]|nr:hypothetical protein NQZ68_004066 [Dissostichus eleginoides]